MVSGRKLRIAKEGYECDHNFRMPDPRREKQCKRTGRLRRNSETSRAPKGPAQASGLAEDLNLKVRTPTVPEPRKRSLSRGETHILAKKIAVKNGPETAQKKSDVL